MQDENENKTTTEETPHFELYSDEYYAYVIADRRRIRKEAEEFQKKLRLEYVNKERQENGLPPLDSLENKTLELEERLNHVGDDFNALDNIPATIIYIFVMVGGAIFNDRILIWVFATFIWLQHIFRMDIKKNQIRKEERKR